MTTIKQILVPVRDIDKAIEFYSKTFGFSVKFKDEQRYAALDGGTITLALVSSEENLTGDQVAISVAVEEANQFLEGVRGNGVKIVLDISEGPHEKRAVVADPDGNSIVVYSKN